MSRPIPIAIGANAFPTKTAALARCSEILWKYKPGDIVRSEDFQFLCDLIERHPNADQKIGCGAAGFTVQETEYGPGTQGFRITRLDGSSTDFSFIQCITPRKPWHSFSAACRTAVVDQKLAFKNAAFRGAERIPCALTGVLVSRTESQVDHTTPQTFQSLICAWLKSNELECIDVPVTSGGDGSTQTRISDERLLRSWQEYHRVHAKMRIAETHAHLKLPKDAE